MRSITAITLAISTSTLLSCSTALAQWAGFPLSESGLHTWSEMQAAYEPIRQLYEATAERCDVAGIAPPHWVTTMYGSDHTNGVVEVVATNALGPVEYTYIADAVTVTKLVYPYVTHTMMSAIDDVIWELIPHYASTNVHLSPESTYGAYTRPMVFREADVGHVVVVLSTNAFDVVTTNEYARWTRSPPRAWNETLIEEHNTGAWYRVFTADVEWRTQHDAEAVIDMNDLPLPIVFVGSTQYVIQVDLAGVDVRGSNRTETVTAGDASTIPWASITNVSASGGSTGDWFRIAYTNNIPVYGDRPFRLYASDLDERWKVLDRLRRTAHQGGTQHNRWFAIGYFHKGVSWEDIAEALLLSWLDDEPDESFWSIGNWLRTYTTFGVLRRRGGMVGINYRKYITGVSTNRLKRMESLIYLVKDMDDDFGYVTVVEHDTFGYGETNVWTTMWQSDWTDANAITQALWYPSMSTNALVRPDPPTPWVSFPPEVDPVGAHDVHERRGPRIPHLGSKVLLEWEFDY